MFCKCRKPIQYPSFDTVGVKIGQLVKPQLGFYKFGRNFTFGAKFLQNWL